MTPKMYVKCHPGGQLHRAAILSTPVVSVLRRNFGFKDNSVTDQWLYPCLMLELQRSDEWEYGSDPDDDEDRVAGSGSDEEASDQGPQDYAEDEFDDVDYHDQSYRHHKGFDLVIDPTERLNSDEEPDD